MVGEKDDVRGLLSRMGTWLLTAVVTALSYVIYDIHDDVDRHNGEFSGRWTPSFYDAIVADIRYPLIHEEYRELYVAQNEIFHEQVRQFMGAGGRFSADDGRALEERIRRLEQNCAVLMARPSHVGGRHYYNDKDDFNASKD